MKHKIETIPESIISQARHLLGDDSYSSRLRMDTVRLLIGTCSICNGIPTKYVIDNHDGINVITRYCEKCFIKYQKYNKPKPKRKVKK